MQVPKAERLREFYRRLADAPRSSTFDEAFTQLAGILDEVEDELTNIPNDPNNWRWDDRIYPPQQDNMGAVPGHPRVMRFRSVKHRTYIGANGSLEIVSLEGTIELRKPGLNGRGVWELDPK
ncbi:hypothetical protein [Longimicrobium sp.]|uniref:hypothetical protein n=1 Tax=Longimicrobium sp. TaxID=2029185 RepID=UPI002E31FC44|nr:hypothetical protein [Longimicrobium sp.]HEX6040206.1 hypothetical protein [Longimicrobium sp.]